MIAFVRRRMLFLGILAGLTWPSLFASAITAEESPVEFRFHAFQHAEDSGRTELQGEHVRLSIRSSRGIGRCRVLPVKGGWPAHVTVLLENLRELEHAELVVNRLVLQGARRQSGEFELRFKSPPPPAQFESPVAPAPNRVESPAGQVDIKVEVRPEGVLLTLPAHLLAADDELELHWIDWYR